MFRSERCSRFGMEEQGVAGVHLDVDQRQPLEDLLDAVHVGAGLLAGQDVIDPAQPVRALDDLQAAVLPACDGSTAMNTLTRSGKSTPFWYQ